MATVPSTEPKTLTCRAVRRLLAHARIASYLSQHAPQEFSQQLDDASRVFQEIADRWLLDGIVLVDKWEAAIATLEEIIPAMKQRDSDLPSTRSIN